MPGWMVDLSMEGLAYWTAVYVFTIWLLSWVLNTCIEDQPWRKKRP